MRAVENALSKGIPVIRNSDQGSPFKERLWRSLKYENIYLREYRSPREAQAGIENYLRFYTGGRPHQSLKYITLLEIYKILLNVEETERPGEPDSDWNLLGLTNEKNGLDTWVHFTPGDRAGESETDGNQRPENPQ